MPNPQVTFPAYFTPANAVAFANPDSSAQVVSALTPLPVTVASTSATLPVTATSLPLPTGAANATNQVATNASLSTISGQLPGNLGVKTAASSLSIAPASDASFVTTIADGAQVTIGARADAAATNVTSAWSVIALLKYIVNATLAPLAAGSNLIGQVQPSYLAPAPWAAPGTGQDMRAYAAVTVVITTAPTAAYTLQWSPDNTNWFALSGLDLNFNMLTSIATTFTGAITLKGGGYVRLSGGTGGVFQISAGQ